MLIQWRGKENKMNSFAKKNSREYVLLQKYISLVSIHSCIRIKLRGSLKKKIYIEEKFRCERLKRKKERKDT